MIDIKKLKQDINDTANELAFIKELFRESHQPRLTYKVHRECRSLKQRATLLCSLRAHLRGRIHLKGTTLVEQSSLVNDALNEYKKPISEAA